MKHINLKHELNRLLPSITPDAEILDALADAVVADAFEEVRQAVNSTAALFTHDETVLKPG